MEHRKLVIIGGGPAGCAAALSAISSGADDVTIIEKEPIGRHRIGEILLTQTILELNKLGIAEEISEYAKKYEWGRKFAAAYVHGSNRTPWKVQNNHPLASSEDQPHIPRCFVDEKTQLWYTLMVRRHEFDEALREICQKRGVKIIHGAVRNLKIIGQEVQNSSFISWIEIESEENKIKISADFIIDATGQQAFIPRQLNARKIVDDWNLQARYTYFNNVDFDKAQAHGLFKEGANIISFEDGWSWVAHLGKDITSVGIVSKIWDKEENNFWNKLNRLPEFDTFGLSQAKVVDCYGEKIEQDSFYAHPNYRFRSEIMRGKNWACAGDAAMFLDPLLSQGVTLAISFGSQIGKIAHQLVEEGSWNQDMLKFYEMAYISEIETLNKVVSQWYHKDFEFDKNWVTAAKKISNIFGREIGQDVESFRWVSNLENIHHIFNDKHDGNFLKQLNDVNNVKMIHDFEKYQINRE